MDPAGFRFLVLVDRVFEPFKGVLGEQNVFWSCVLVQGL